MGRKNQKLARKSKPKPRRATPGESRAWKEAEEKRLQSVAAEAAIVQPVSGAKEIGKEGTRDDNAEIRRRSGVDPDGDTLEAASAASNAILPSFQNLVSRPKSLAPVPAPNQQLARRLHLALRRKEELGGLRDSCIEERGVDGADIGNEEDGDGEDAGGGGGGGEEKMTEPFFWMW
ncbi:hypothetical protein BPAE_0124g00360 [Botrytis paeoniae]|uniref:Uncharacterized protein n=1 Tax=Botrytis paeoniae TaxID=278948 RepID=A0A4Z1FMC1_9HELO|nr:hypothetical protein BPAE_0124g00360 [Botrytis paeoniae]